ncbi:MAG TPA: histidine phosphatase family protein [Tepidisphaeraceae bacterium]|nr:histidine phosphatase family protein [Tepidisphaeraceae bacterium]
MLRLLFITAGPTPWDEEGRIVGSRPLPLTSDGVSSITQETAKISEPPARVLCPMANEACAQGARIVGEAFQINPRNEADLEEINLGLWEGLTRQDLRFRYPTSFPQWEENPLAVNPPDGEALPAAIERAAGVIAKLRRRKKKETTVLVLRPMILQVMDGLLREEGPEKIAAHLQKVIAAQSIEI